MAGGALIVAAELIPNPMVDLFIAAYILHPAGLALLFFSTLGFIGLAYVTQLTFMPVHLNLRQCAEVTIPIAMLSG